MTRNLKNFVIVFENETRPNAHNILGRHMHAPGRTNGSTSDVQAVRSSRPPRTTVGMGVMGQQQFVGVMGQQLADPLGFVYEDGLHAPLVIWYANAFHAFYVLVECPCVATGWGAKTFLMYQHQITNQKYNACSDLIKD